MTPSDPTRLLRRAIGSAFIAAAAVQVVKRDVFTELVPEQVGAYRRPIQAAMTAGLAGMGLTFFFPKARLASRWPATVMLVATLPAAVAQTRQPEEMKRLGLPMPLVVLRIPAQLLMIAGIWRATRPCPDATSCSPRPSA